MSAKGKIGKDNTEKSEKPLRKKKAFLKLIELLEENHTALSRGIAAPIVFLADNSGKIIHSNLVDICTSIKSENIPSTIDQLLIADLLPENLPADSGSSYDFEIEGMLGQVLNIGSSEEQYLYLITNFENLISPKVTPQKAKYESIHKELWGSKRLYEILSNNNSTGIFKVSGSGKILECNKAFARIIGSTTCEQIAKGNYFTFFKDEKEIKELIKDAKVTGKFCSSEHLLVKSNGEPSWILQNLIHLYDDLFEGSVIDISKRKLNEEDLRKALLKNEELNLYLKSIMETAPDAIIIFDKKGNIIDLNEACTALFGYSPEIMLTLKINNIGHDLADDVLITDRLKEALHGVPQNFEWIGIKNNKSEIPINVRLKAMSVNSSEYVLAVLTDISRIRENEFALKEKERFLLDLVANLPGIVYRCKNDLNWTMVFLSDGCFELTGYQPAEVLFNSNLSFGDLIHPEDQQFVWDSVQEQIRKRKSYTLTYRLITADDKIKWVWEQGFGVYEGKELLYLEGFITDITDRKKAEEALKKSEEFLRLIFDSSDDLIMMQGMDGEIMYLNLPSFFELDSNQFIGKKPVEIFGDGLNTEFNNRIDAVIDSKLRVTTEDKISWKGKEYWFLAQTSPVFDTNDKIIACVTISRNITKQKEVEEELRRYAEDLNESKKLLEEKANQLISLNHELRKSEQELKTLNADKDKLFSIVAHDLKSPFQSLLGFSEFLANELEDLNNEQIKEFSLNIYKSAKGVFSLIENLLEWSRLQTGRVEFNPVNFSLDEVLMEIVYVHQVSAVKKMIKMKNEVPERIILFGDVNMVATILRNLVSNAIKFTNYYGTVTIEAAESLSEVTISVIDTGVGMSEKEVKSLFRIGEQKTIAGTDEEKGTGLGLIICKELIEKNKGKIWVESNSGKGSKFSISLPKGK